MRWVHQSRVICMINLEVINFNTFLYKLFWYKPTQLDDPSSVPYISLNVGKKVAQFISERKIGKHIGLDVEDYFKALVSESSHEYYDAKGIALKNIGILLETELSLNVVRILLDLSREYVIILIWPYGVENFRRLVWDDTTTNSLDFPEQTIHRLEV